MPEVTPLWKAPKAAPKKGVGVRAQRAGQPAAQKRRATKLWGAVVHARDVGCVVCGRHDGKLDAHHVCVREFVWTRTDENNGILACYRDHQRLHGDPVFAVNFYSEHYGVEGYRLLREKAHGGVGKKLPAGFWAAECVRLEALLERYGA